MSHFVFHFVVSAFVPCDLILILLNYVCVCTANAAADTIYENTKVGTFTADFKQVKTAFESTYAKIGISCTDVGGLWNEGEKTYYPGAEPCVETVSSMNSTTNTETNSTLAIALGCTFGALSAMAAGMVLYMRSKEKQGEPVFKTTEEDVKDLN